MKFMRMGRNPQELLDSYAHSNQPFEYRMFLPGFEDLFEQMPIMDTKEPVNDQKIGLTRNAFTSIGDRLMLNPDDFNIMDVSDGQFARYILGVEEPRVIDGKLKQGSEIVLALWGKGFSSPVHGHGFGYLHEQLLKGGFNVFFYDSVGQASSRLALLDRIEEVVEPGIFTTGFAQDLGQEPHSAIIHNFTSLESNTWSLHYVPEHTRDGSDNRYRVVGTRKDFALQGLDVKDVVRVTGDEAMKSEIGDIYLVRSSNVAGFGDHYILITGGLIQKPHGLRPEEVVFKTNGVQTPLDDYSHDDPLVLLKLNDGARAKFYDHYDIRLEFRK